MIDSKISSLDDLNGLRSAPSLDSKQLESLSKELSGYMKHADWYTIGVMAPSSKQAIFIIKEMEKHFGWPAMKVRNNPKEIGPVFLKANQRTGDIHIRIEYGLGEGILISCQNNDELICSKTFGPFPLDFFTAKE